MKNRKLFISIIILSLVLASAMAGCQLAKPPVATENTDGDMLVGVFITTEYFNLFNAEEYFTDMMNNKDVNIEDYRERLYAEPVATELIINEYTGESEEIVTEYEFKGVEGIKYIAIYEDDVAGMGYSSQCLDEPLSWTSQKVGVHEYDTHSEHSLDIDAKVFLSEAGGIMHINPIYKTAEGDIYTVNGSSCAVSSAGNMSHSLKEEITHTIDGVKKVYSRKVTVTFEVVDPSEKLTLVYMDINNNEISRTDYISSTLPQSLTITNGAEYIIVESMEADENGNVITVRNLYDRENNQIPFYKDRGDGICIKGLTDIVWE